MRVFVVPKQIKVKWFASNPFIEPIFVRAREDGALP